MVIDLFGKLLYGVLVGNVPDHHGRPGVVHYLVLPQDEHGARLCISEAVLGGVEVVGLVDVVVDLRAHVHGAGGALLD